MSGIDPRLLHKRVRKRRGETARSFEAVQGVLPLAPVHTYAGAHAIATLMRYMRASWLARYMHAS
jgi:hypothetical protein